MLDDIEFHTLAKQDPDCLLAFYERVNHEVKSDREKVQKMVDNSFCLVTAWHDGEVIGFARGVTDGLTGRLAECKLDPAYQGPGCVTKKEGRIEHDTNGIAREMAARVIDALRGCGVERIETLAYGTEQDFCEELGFKKLRGVVALELSLDVPVLAEASDSLERTN